MKAYLIATFVVTFINFINEKFFLNSTHKKTRAILFFTSLLVLCLIAGVRNTTVGTDINVYVVRLMNLANNYDNPFSFIVNSNSDFLFALIVYIGNLTNNIGTVLFLIELAVALPIYIFAYLERNSKPFSISIFIFLMVMYAASFNIMRQSIAISICILAYHFWDNKYRKLALFTIFIAFLFHKTSIIFLAIFLVNFVVKGKIKNKELFLILTIVLIAIVPLLLDRLIGLTIYSEYLTRESLMRDFSFGAILKKVFWLLLSIFTLFRFKNQNLKDDMTISMFLILISLVLTFTSFTIPGTGRLGYYFNNLFYFLSIPDIPKVFKQKNIAMVSLLSILVLFWWNMTAVENDSSRVYPYKSDLVKVLE